MSRQLSDLLGQVLLIVLCAVMFGTPIIISVLGIINFRRDKMRQAKSALQALGALAIWAFLSFVVVMIFFMTVFEYPVNTSRANEVIANIIYFGVSSIYFLVGGVLIYWTKRQTRRMPSMGISC